MARASQTFHDQHWHRLVSKVDLFLNSYEKTLLLSLETTKDAYLLLWIYWQLFVTNWTLRGAFMVFATSLEKFSILSSDWIIGHDFIVSSLYMAWTLTFINSSLLFPAQPCAACCMCVPFHVIPITLCMRSIPPIHVPHLFACMPANWTLNELLFSIALTSDLSTSKCVRAKNGQGQRL